MNKALNRKYYFFFFCLFYILQSIVVANGIWQLTTKIIVEKKLAKRFTNFHYDK